MKVVERLYSIFGKFEMPSIALCYAIAFGNDGNARTLMEHGVTLGISMDPVLLKGDTPSKQANRKKRYIDDVLCEGASSFRGGWALGFM